MYIDIVVPKENEDGFVRMAERLGYSKICFLYEQENYKSQAEINELLEKKGCKTKVVVFSGIITSSKNVQKARNKADLIVVRETENIRDCVEKQRPDIIFGMEEQNKRDYMHQRNSGINQVVCDIANDKHVSFGIPLKNVIEYRNKPQLFGRFMQNIRLYKKYKCSVSAFSLAENPLDMRAPIDSACLFSTLGFNLKEAKDLLKSADNIIERNKKIRDRKIIGDGFEIVD